MKLVIILGNIAVGKMTVGQNLMKLTNFRLFHNHMTIEPVIDIFGYYDGRIVERLRNIIFEEFANSDCEGLIFTFVCDFNDGESWAYLERVVKQFEDKGATSYYVELIASKQTRIHRNTTENRLKHKISKRNIEFSHANLLQTDENHRCESYPGEIKVKNYLRIDTEHLKPNEVAQKIKDHFEL